MFWTGFVACIGLVICDHLLAGFRSERRARASFMASLSEDEQKQFKALESKSDWETARSLIEIERNKAAAALSGLD